MLDEELEIGTTEDEPEEDSGEDEEELLSRSYEADFKAFDKKVKIHRPEDWEPLDYDRIYEEFEQLSRFECKMIANTCKTTEIAIKAIKASRKSNADFAAYMAQVKYEKRKEIYRRRYYRDTEDDIENLHY